MKMTEYTDEELKTLIEKAQQETRAQQQWAIAGDRATRLMVLSVAQSVQNGLDDPYVQEVAKAIRDWFIRANFTQQPPHQEQPDEVPKQD